MNAWRLPTATYGFVWSTAPSKPATKLTRTTFAASVADVTAIRTYAGLSEDRRTPVQKDIPDAAIAERLTS